MNVIILDEQEKIAAVDKGSLLSVVSRFPEMVREALAFRVEGNIPPGPYENVVIAGMGGSAISGEILVGLYGDKFNVPVSVKRGYNLPGFVNEKSLVVLISYSGGTEETLQILKSAEKQKAKIVVIACGGTLKESAEKKGYARVIVPTGLQPRAALPYLFFALQSIFESAKLITVTSKDKEEAIKVLSRLREEYGPASPTMKNKAKQIAQKIMGKLPLVMGSEGITGAVAYRWKCQFNENSHQLAICSLLPEMSHNEIVGLGQLERGANQFALMVLRQEGDSERIKKRIEITKSLLAAKVGGIIQVEAEGENPLARCFSLILLGDFVSVYLAILLGQDPSNIDIINRLKKEMSR